MKKVLFAAIIVLVLGIMLAGCGGGGSANSPQTLDGVWEMDAAEPEDREVLTIEGEKGVLEYPGYGESYMCVVDKDEKTITLTKHFGGKAVLEYEIIQDALVLTQTEEGVVTRTSTYHKKTGEGK